MLSASGEIDDDFNFRLADLDDALRANRPATLVDETDSLPSELRQRLEQGGAWCEFVRAAWTYLKDDPLPDEPIAPVDGDTPRRFGRFELHRELGRGAYGVVFLAYDPRLRRQVALKLPRPEVLVTAEMRARFKREAHAAAALDHPNLVPVYDAGEEGPISYIASAYCPGPTLADWLRDRDEPVPPRLAARIVLPLARAIAHAHARGVLHRDLKPGNVILEPLPAGAATESAPDGMRYVPRVTDFGLARLSAAGPDAAAATQTGEILGTPSYMSPEQADGRVGTIGPTTDVYGLGAILYALLTGRPPFQSHSPLDTMLLLRTEEPIAPSRLRPRLPLDLETVCLKCLQKDSSRRYRGAGELAEDLERCLAGESIRARATPGWERALKWARRHPAPAALIVVTAAAVATVIAVVLIANTRLQKQIQSTETRRIEAQRNLEEAETQRQKAVANLHKARDAVDRMVIHVGEVRLGGNNLPQSWAVRRDLFEDAVRYYEDLALQTGDDPDLRLSAGRARRLLGFTLSGLAQKDKAEQLLHTALEQLTSLATAYPNRPAYLHELASCQFELAAVFWETGRLAEALELAHQARKLQEALVAADPARDDARYNLAQIFNLLGMIFQAKQDASQSEKFFRDGLAVLDPVLKRVPPDDGFLRREAIFNNNLAEILAQNGRSAEAEPFLLKNRAYWEDLAARFPSDFDHRSKLALTYRNLAQLYLSCGRTSDAELAFRRVADLRLRLTNEVVEQPHHRNQLGDVLRQLSSLAAGRGDRLEACRLIDQAIRNHQLTVKLSSTTSDHLRSLGADWMALADLRPQLSPAEVERATTDQPALFSLTAAEKIAVASILARCVPLLDKDPQIPRSRCKQVQERYAAQAIIELAAAVRLGFNDFDAIRLDPAFDGLRAREDFKKLLPAVEMGTAAEPKAE